MTSNKLLDKLLEGDNFKETENGCLTLKSSLSATLDFFSLAGSYRARTDVESVTLFAKAFSEDKLTALRALFYVRDVRGGLGERKVFRCILKYLSDVYPDIVAKNIQNVPFYGRWDDLFKMFGTKSERTMIDYIKKQIEADKTTDKPSLLGKWLKSSNKGSKHKITSRALREKLGLRSVEYRKLLSSLRSKIKIVESKMCANEWESIDFSKITSKSGMNYAKSFRKHEPERYQEYIDSVKSGKAKINAKTLFPYEFIRRIENLHLSDTGEMETLDTLWKNLPNYCTKKENALVLCDTSESMVFNNDSLPIFNSIALSIYFAERNDGAFKKCFMGFSRVPTMYKLKGDTLYEKYMSVKDITSAHENTDIIACFKLILKTAIDNHIHPDEMPTRLFMITDMEFDRASQDNSLTTFQTIDDMYKKYNYARPMLVFWNVNARSDQSQATFDSRGVFLVSGSSPITFKHVMESKAFTPIELMLDVLNSERYQRVVI